ncbi:MAG: ATP-binding cassette, subfamily er 3 [Solirubrobacteraceae bacterium]|nr:ATP-binding cassette, subfamily er 3 [Solirubrobacteraceae bacterium]
MSVALQLNEVVKSFGGRNILEGTSLEVLEGARVGLIGPNGAGKSTLLRMLAGEETPDAGTVTLRRGAVVAFLPQLVTGDERTVREWLLGARPDHAARLAELDDVERRLADPALAEDLRRMGRLLERQAALVAEVAAEDVEGEGLRILRDLGLPDSILERETRRLSGGQAKLVALAACLVRRPDVLLLDEPEAHLDVRRRTRLEELLRALPGCVLMVSHDRYLLDETVTAIAELDDGRIRMWPGTYSAYAVARELAMVRQQQAYVTQQKEIARLEDAIRRFKDLAHRTEDKRYIIRARNKQRQIERMDTVDRPVFERRKMGLALRASMRGGERVVDLRDVEFDPVLTGVNLTILRGERIGVIGPNGSGKTVLVRLLAAELAPTAGERWAGPSIAFDHLTQTAAELPGDQTAMDVVRAAQPMTEETAVRHLMRFLFDYEQVRRPIGAMSGGERTRLRCLLLMLGGANCLLLDEPTNHLDIESVEVLEHALEAFDGTVIAVSHDRYFLDRMADRIVEVRDLEVRSHEGGYSDWSERAVRERGTSL